MAGYREQVTGFLRQNFLFDDTALLGEDDSLLETGVIDSTGILEVVAWLEETFNLHVEDDELVPDNFDSVARLATFLERKLGSAA